MIIVRHCQITVDNPPAKGSTVGNETPPWHHGPGVMLPEGVGVPPTELLKYNFSNSLGARGKRHVSRRLRDEVRDLKKSPLMEIEQ